MNDFVDKGEVTRWFDFTGQTNTENARVQCTFVVSVGEEKESTLSGVKSIVKKANTEENRKTLTTLGGAALNQAIPDGKFKDLAGKALDGVESPADLLAKGKDMLEQIQNLKEALTDKDKAMELMKEKLTELAKEKAMEMVKEKLGENAGEIAGNLVEGAASKIGMGAQKNAAIAKQSEEIGVLLDTLNHCRKKMDEAEAANKKLEMVISGLNAEIATLKGSSPNEGYY